MSSLQESYYQTVEMRLITITPLLTPLNKMQTRSRLAIELQLSELLTQSLFPLSFHNLFTL